METKKRIAHALASAGIASRRGAESLIAKGKVEVNGVRVDNFALKVDLATDRVKVNGKRITVEERKVYFLVNKPAGMLCTSQKGPAKIVLELFSHLPYRLFTVGRLDQQTTGMILVTNDGQLAHRLMHPSFEIQKEYVAKVVQEVTPEALKKMAEGMWLEGGHVKPIRVAKVRRGTVKIVVGEGKKHEVRRLLAHANLEVKQLSRVRIGSLHLGHLPLGTYRELASTELDELLGVTED